MSWLCSWLSRNRRSCSGQKLTLERSGLERSGRSGAGFAHSPSGLVREAGARVSPAARSAAGGFFLCSLDVARGGERPDGPYPDQASQRRPPPLRALGTLRSVPAWKGRFRCRNHYSAKGALAQNHLWAQAPGRLANSLLAASQPSARSRLLERSGVGAALAEVADVGAWGAHRLQEWATSAQRSMSAARRVKRPLMAGTAAQTPRARSALPPAPSSALPPTPRLGPPTPR
jgi:hypothetical protein